MNSQFSALLVLLGIAIFLIFRLRSVLGTRDGFESQDRPGPMPPQDQKKTQFEVIEGGPDHDIIDHVAADSPPAKALSDMKRASNQFKVSDFLAGARGAYEMIIMGFENGDLDGLKSFLSQDVYDTFAAVIAERNAQGVTVEAAFIGVRETKIQSATFNPTTSEAEITVLFQGELTSVIKNQAGDIVEGNPSEIKRQRDIWTFSHNMADDNPNWILVATDA
jgi:predicted lipid-binding transport protein (Tim44 family)